MSNLKKMNRGNVEKILYKIRFDPAPKEIIFELRQNKPVLVRDVIRVMNSNFKRMDFEVTLNSKTLNERETDKYGRTYIVKFIKYNLITISN